MLDSLIDDSVDGYFAEWTTRKDRVGGGCLFSASRHQLDIMFVDQRGCSLHGGDKMPGGGEKRLVPWQLERDI